MSATENLETISILEEAARWLVSKGIDQWKPGSVSRQRIAARIERGEMYLAELSGHSVGTLALQWSDEETWGRTADDAGYVHGLAVRRGLASRGLGRELLGPRTWRLRPEKKYLRLDCVAGNSASNAYYERAGFGYRGRALVRGLEVSLYEKQVGVSGAG